MRRGWLRWAVLVGAVAAAAGPLRAADSRVPAPVIEPARAGTQCIADPATMRREHPAMLEHQRDQTVRGGVRGAKASLKACIGCHASATTGSVAQTQTNFCVSCHSYTAVRLDCFGCHATRAEPGRGHAGAQAGPLALASTMLAAPAARPTQAGPMPPTGPMPAAHPATRRGASAVATGAKAP